jgi:membrane protease YdiL (CAAX protease family)
MKLTWISHSRLFELARRGRRLTHLLAVIPLAFLIAFIGQFGSLPVMFFLIMRNGLSEDLLSMGDMPVSLSGLWMALFLISAFLLIYVFVGLWVYFYERRPFWTLGYERAGALSRYARGFVLGVLIFAASVAILMAFGAVTQEAGNASNQGAAAVAGVLLVLFGWLVQGGAEELLTRGWVLPVVGARTRPWVGLLVSSLVFAVMHSLNPGLSPLAMLNLALFGLFAGLYALREGSIWGISALHSSWNWVQGNIFGFQVSGTGSGGGTLVDLAARGPAWLTGAEFGPEGGAAVTVVLLIGTLLVLFWPRPSKEPGPAEF